MLHSYQNVFLYQNDFSKNCHQKPSKPLFKSYPEYDILIKYTVLTQNSDTQNSHISQNSDTFFALTFFKSENGFSKILNKESNANTRIYTLAAKSFTSQNSDIFQNSDISQKSNTFFGVTKMSLF